MTQKPTPPVVSGALPGLGHVLEFMQDRAGLVQRGFEAHGPVFTIKMATKNVAVVIGPEYHRIYFSETDKKLNISTPYKFLRASFGEVLFIAPHAEYLRQRPIVTQAFRREKMAEYIEVMQHETQRWLDSLGDSGEFEVAAELRRLAQDIAGSALMGEKFQQEVGSEFWSQYGLMEKSLDPVLPPNLPLPKFRRRDQARARLTEIMRPIIAERRQHPEDYDDFLQDFVEARYADTNEPLDDELLLNLMLGLMFAGHETTAGQSAWNIILLLQNPDYLALVQEEIDQVLPAGTVFGGQYLHQLKHLGYAVIETERMRPSVDILMRDVNEELEMGDYRIPAGWMVQLAQEVAHNLPELFAAPEVYDPLRFAPGRAEDKQQGYSLIGFGGGSHKCTGMNFANFEQTVIAAMLLQQFELELVTADPQVRRNQGANKPDPTWIRYTRRTAVAQPPAVTESVPAAA